MFLIDDRILDALDRVDSWDLPADCQEAVLAEQLRLLQGPETDSAYALTPAQVHHQLHG